MAKKPGVAISSADWDSSLKEPWHQSFEREPVNDERWTCVVTAAVPAKPEDDECIRLFTQSVATGTRRAIKILSMSQVMTFLKERDTGDKSQKKVKSETKDEKSSKKTMGKPKSQLQPPPPRISPIVDLAAKYATFNDLECRLPPDLMAGLLKYMILNMKDENVFQKKVDAVRERKQQEILAKARFVKSLKPFQVSERDNDKARQGTGEKVRLEAINDEPCPGPDLYIVLTDFYDPFYFPELLKMNVPFAAIMKISNFHEMTLGKASYITLTGKQDVYKKETLITNFWRILADNCMTMDNTRQFKDFLFMQYHPQFFRMAESNQLVRDAIFDELSWMIYNIYFICRQHQMYLKGMHVQRIFVCLEPLDLSKCTLYNNLCDALVTGEPNTLFLVVYAMIEQVVAGVPETKQIPFEYEPPFSETSFSNSETDNDSNEYADNAKKRNFVLITPCLECRDKKVSTHVCQPPSDASIPDKRERSEITKPVSEVLADCTGEDDTSQQSVAKVPVAEEPCIDLTVTEEVLKDLEMEKSDTSPLVCFYGDRIVHQNYFCDPRLLDPDALMTRFLKNMDVSQLWLKHPKQTLERKAFYNFHFQRLLKGTKETRNSLKIKILFALCMKLLGTINSYLFKGEEEVLSELFRTHSREKAKTLSKVRFDQREGVTQDGKNNRDFSSCFFRVFTSNLDSKKRVTMRTDNAEKTEKTRNSFFKTDSSAVRKVTSVFNMSLIHHRNSGCRFSYCYKAADSSVLNAVNLTPAEKEFVRLFSLLDCYEISNLTDMHGLHTEDEYANLIKNFNFYENLEPNRMVQNMIEAQETFSTTQCSYFAPTDTLIVLLHNDSDYRGLFYHPGNGVLYTPVALRDFYCHVYHEIGDWLAVEKEEYTNFVTEIEEKRKSVEDRTTREYLKKIKREYKEMSPEQVKTFLNANIEKIEQADLEVTEEELRDLPVKPKPDYSNKVSFVGTNLIDLRVQTDSLLNEFHSRDGSEVNVTVDSWLYESVQLLTLTVKQCKFSLIYHQWLEQELNETFRLKVAPGILFVFYKDADDGAENKYKVKITWPTGLRIEGVFNPNFPLNVKQSYMEVYRRRMTLSQEKSRHFLNNGQILIFKENGNVDVLCASGTKHVIMEVQKGPNNKTGHVATQYQTSLMTGEVWTRSKANPCKNKRTLTETIKVYLGVDSKTQETYYKRDDGVCCMLWPNGKLVTTFPDDTKITSIPDFDHDEVVIEWTEDERAFLGNLDSVDNEAKPKSKAILKKLSPDSPGQESRSTWGEADESNEDGWIWVSVSYLMEHPKYATVSYDTKNTSAEVKMPNGLSIRIDPQGTYLVSQNQNFLHVQNDSIELYQTCPICGEKSVASLHLDTSETLCKFVDLLHTTLYVHRNGDTNCQECGDTETCRYADSTSVSEKRTRSSCTKNSHKKASFQNQRCFALERDLSGLEFVHYEALAQYCYTLPPDAYYELHSKRETDAVFSHLFSRPHYKIGHEKWVMEYEDADSSLPTNLKKKDLRELGTKDTGRKMFKYPFSRPSEESTRDPGPPFGPPMEMPKIIETRIVKCLSKDTRALIEEVKDHVSRYQKKAKDICSLYKTNRQLFEGQEDGQYVKDKSQKTCVPLNPKWMTFPHLATMVPSSETEIHRAGHHINLLREFEETDQKVSPKCIQLPVPKAKTRIFPPVYEKSNSRHDET